jgi:hypothetical protein
LTRKSLAVARGERDASASVTGEFAMKPAPFAAALLPLALAACNADPQAPDSTVTATPAASDDALAVEPNALPPEDTTPGANQVEGSAATDASSTPADASPGASASATGTPYADLANTRATPSPTPTH